MSTLSGTHLTFTGADLAEQRANLDEIKAQQRAALAQRLADGDDPDKKRARVAAGCAKSAAKQKGREQKHPLEGALLNVVVSDLEKYMPREVFKKLRFLYPFDCNKADFAIGRVGEDKYTAIQIKTRQIQFGKSTNYTLRRGDYAKNEPPLVSRFKTSFHGAARFTRIIQMG